MNELGLATVVVRPDSGNPVHVICGFKILEGFADIEAFSKWVYDHGTFELGMYEVVKIGDTYRELQNLTWTSCDIDAFLGREMKRVEAIGAIESLWESFGGHTNTKGYKVLNSYIGLIYGDSITVERTEQIFERLAEKGFASSNVVLGIGSYTYQYNTRDTFGMAMKATACEVQNELIELYKDPKTAASKKSAKGFLRVVKDAKGNYSLEQEVDMDWKDLYYGSGELKPLFHNGKFQRAELFRDVRSRIDATFVAANSDDGFDPVEEAA
ncbi:putative nicotinate phosphoribosyltransferase [compost metagenome]